MRKLTTTLLAAAGIMVVGSALADLTVKDGGGVTRTIKNFVCETTKLCNATVLIKSDGTEIGTTAEPLNVDAKNFTPNGNYATLTATAASSASTALPSGAVVAFQNTSNIDVSCVLSTGAATATTNKLVVHGGSTVYYAVGSNVNTACINQTGADSNVIGLAGGSGLGIAFGTLDWSSLVANVAQSGTWTVQPGNTANTTPWLVTVDNTNANGQATMANSSPVVIASNQTANALWGHGVTGAAVPANATYFGFNSGGNLVGPAAATPLPVRPGDGTRNAIVDPCEGNLQTYATGVITSGTTTRIIAPSASNKTYLCAFFMKASAADNVAMVEGTGGTCGTGTAALLGGTTTANGFVFGTAGDGVLLQAGGKVAIVQTAGTNVDTCLITSTAGPLIWSAKYVQAP